MTHNPTNLALPGIVRLAGLGALKLYRAALTYGWKEASQQNRGWILIVAGCTLLAIILDLTKRIGRWSSSALAQSNVEV